MGTLKSQLKQIAPMVAAATAARQRRDVKELYADFCTHLKDQSVTDPRGEKLVFRKHDFPYLIKLEFFNEKMGKWTAAKAAPTIKALEAGILDEARHQYDLARAKGLLRIAEILANPDSIHVNIHPRVTGDMVYVVRVSAGFKIAFVKKKGPEWGIVTSFYTTESYLKTCAGEPPIFSK
jgi:hypothetical protein